MADGTQSAPLRWWTRAYEKSARPFKKPYHAFRRALDRWLPSWRLEITLGILLSLTSLLVNTIFLIVSFQRSSPGPNSLGVFSTGQCYSINLWNQVCHAFINIASTLVLQQSNTVMQILASPYRHEVDEAHRKREWLDIGIPSLRNVWKRSIAPARVSIWWLLALSSTLLHLLWNSIILSSPRATTYLELAVDQRFVSNSSSFNATIDIPGALYSNIGFNGTGTGTLYPDNLNLVQASLNNSDIWELLTTSECAERYAQSFLRDRSDVIVIIQPTAGVQTTSSIFGASYAGWGTWPYYWMCPEANTLGCKEMLVKNEDKWTVTINDRQEQVTGCYSKTLEDLCSLEYVYSVTILVVCANFVKLACFTYTYYLLLRVERRKKGEDTNLLLSNEDAIASFLRVEDPETHGMCLAEKRDFENGLWSFLVLWVEIQPRKWHEQRKKSWFRAVGKGSWFSLMTLLFLITFASGIFVISLIPYFMSIGLSGEALVQFGIGNAVGQFLFGGQKTANFDSAWATIGDIIAANLPQLLLSVVQFWWTSQMTTMLAARDYDKFATESRKLTPSHQEWEPDQKAIGLPWKYRWLNFVLWTIIPWLASQAIFFAKIDVVDHWLYPTTWSISQVGYSVLGMILFTAASFCAFVIGLWMGLRRLQNRIPLAGTCSAAISAACHPSDRSMEHHKEKVQWGVEEKVEMRGEAPVHRCTFTSSESVTRPVEGDESGFARLYA